MPEKKEKTPEGKPTKVNEEKSKVNSFLRILLVSIIAIVGAYSWTTYDYKTRQQNIIEAQNNQLSKLDSIMGSFYTQSMQLSKDTAYYKVLLDSISNSENNKQAYTDSVVKSVISAAIRTQNNRELTEQLRKDSIFVHTQIGQIQNDTKNQLSLEFNKLQNEYYTLQLWGGILTIVFLIFTFYSLFKTDDLMKQGKDGLKDIQKIKNDSEVIVEKTKTEQKAISDQIELLKAQISEIEKSKNQNEEDTRNLGTEIDKKRQAFQDSLKLNDEVTVLRKQIGQLSIDVTSLLKLYESIGDKEEKSETFDESLSEELAQEEVEPEESIDTIDEDNDKQDPKQ